MNENEIETREVPVQRQRANSISPPKERDDKLSKRGDSVAPPKDRENIRKPPKEDPAKKTDNKKKGKDK